MPEGSYNIYIYLYYIYRSHVVNYGCQIPSSDISEGLHSKMHPAFDGVVHILDQISLGRHLIP